MENESQEEKASAQVLVIRTGGIGPFVQALGAFAAIRMHHSGARVTLATDDGVAEFSSAAPYFDVIEKEGGSITRLRTLVRSRAWDIVYDLDSNAHSDRVYRSSLTWRQRFGLEEAVTWCGTAKGCAIPHANP